MWLGPVCCGQVSPHRGNNPLFGQTCGGRMVEKPGVQWSTPGGSGEEGLLKVVVGGQEAGDWTSWLREGGGQAWREELSRDPQVGRFQSLGFIIQYSFSSPRCHKLCWHYTRSRDMAEPPGGELGAGKSHCSRQVPLKCLTPWPVSGPPEVPEKAGPRGRGMSEGSGTAGGEGKSLPEKHRGQTPWSSIRASSRPEFWKLIGPWDKPGRGLVLLCHLPSCWSGQ